MHPPSGGWQDCRLLALGILWAVAGMKLRRRSPDGHATSRQVRETSRKPDEMYSLLERLSPGTRKLEIFARQHNCQPGWVSLGNQVLPSLANDFLPLKRLGRQILLLSKKSQEFRYTPTCARCPVWQLKKQTRASKCIAALSVCLCIKARQKEVPRA